MKPWHFRWVRGLIYGGAAIAAVSVVVSCKWDEPELGSVLIAARQLYGLWALGLLLASMILGPLTSVFPWIPFKSSLMYGRRAVGVSALIFAVLHVAAYLWSVLRRNWHELYTPGILWVAGLILGLLVLSDMIALGVTSRDAAVKKMGGRRWKKLHQTVYAVLAVVLIHAVFVGADFGVNAGPDVKGEADYGAFIGFLCVAATWAVLAILRRRNLKWTPKFMAAAPASTARQRIS